jgi:hypothetical protein
MFNKPVQALALTFSTAVVVAAMAGSAAVAATPTQTSDQTTIGHPVSGAAVNGLIMRDGGICDPIRHMGC